MWRGGGVKGGNCRATFSALVSIRTWETSLRVRNSPSVQFSSEKIGPRKQNPRFLSQSPQKGLRTQTSLQDHLFSLAMPLSRMPPPPMVMQSGTHLPVPLV